MMFVSTWTTSLTTPNYLNISEWLCQQYLNTVSTLSHVMWCCIKVNVGLWVCVCIRIVHLQLFLSSFVPFVPFVASSSKFCTSVTNATKAWERSYLVFPLQFQSCQHSFVFHITLLTHYMYVLLTLLFPLHFQSHNLSLDVFWGMKG